MYTIGDIIRCSARSYPGRTAVLFEGTSLTYRELNERVNRLCDALRARGVGKGDRLAVLSENTHRYLEVYFAAGKLGISVTPLNFRLADPEILHILDHSESTILFAGDGHEDRALQMVRGLPRIRRSVAMDNRADGFEHYEDLLAEGSSAEPESSVDEEDLAILMYTGGTTGLPKGVMMSHRALLQGFIGAALSFSFSKQDTTCFILPLFHVSFWPAFAHLLVGGTVAIVRRPDLKGIFALIEKERCTHINAVPTIYNWMLQHPDLGAHDLSSLRLITYAGSPFPPELLKKCIHALGPKFAQGYGMTECMGGTMLPVEDHDPERRPRLLASAGRPFPGVDLAIVGSADQRLPANEIGEIVLRGKCLMNAYWKSPEVTASALRGGWYHTGDMGYVDDEGYLFLVDRKADMIVTGGENVYPKEVEDVLYQHPAVAAAAVVSAPDDTWGERVQAVVTLMPGQKVDAEQLIAHCKARLAGYKCPKRVEIWDALPMSPVGKILRKDIKQALWKGHARMIG
jgi:long-chain acyl-CoA synthetase